MVPFLLLMIACEQDGTTETDGAALQGKTTRQVMNSNQIVVLTQEINDIASDVLSSEGISIGGETTSPDDCTPSIERQYIKDVTHYDTTIYSGTIIVDYGDGTSCGAQTIRKGSISNTFTYIINYRDRQTYSVRQRIKFDEFTRDSARVDGEFIVIAKTDAPDTLKINAARITYPDGNFARLTATLVSQRVYSDDGETYTRSVTGHVASSAPDGNFYNADFVEPVEYSYDCGENESLIPVRGKIKLQLGGWDAMIDYGNGACDKLYTVTINGSRETYSF